ncbi:MAG: amidohydrolase family protein [Erysipelotrichaceae bacterium]|nr:amidohydrolase family protein [Erysipelotrichaceae bacterium]
MAETIYQGNILYSTSYDELKVIPNGYILVKDGFIEDVCETLDEKHKRIEVVDYKDKLIIPAFSDLHIHAPQYPQRGIGMDCLLFDWLNNYTFPQESNFQNSDYARSIYAKLIRDLIANGTFQLSLFTTIHYGACDTLFRMLHEAGLYAYTGITNMDRNSTDYYVDTTKDSLEKTERFIQEHQYSKTVKPILTPRFAPTCTKELMLGLGELARKYDLGLQTHLVESRAEAAWAKELFPEYASDGEIYEKCGLLQGSGPKIFAHVIFPTDTEERILKEYSGIAVHCPDATSSITAGIMPLNEMHKKGVTIALGTDVGACHFMGVYHQVARAVQISKMKEFYEEGQKRIMLANAFYLATVNGASIFNRIGKLEKGYRFNALVIDNMLDEEYNTSLSDALERFCYSGDDRNIVARYLDGKLIDPEEVYQRLVNIRV